MITTENKIIMRPRTKITSCYQAKPDGTKHVGREETLRRKFKRDDITPEELHSYAFFTMRHRQPTDRVVVSVFGKETTVTLEEYNAFYKPQNFRILRYV